MELQLELHRSKNQAGRIRDMLREKVSAIIKSIITYKPQYNCGYVVRVTLGGVSSFLLNNVT